MRLIPAKSLTEIVLLRFSERIPAYELWHARFDVNDDGRDLKRDAGTESASLRSCQLVLSYSAQLEP